MAKRIILQPGDVFGRWTILDHLKHDSGKYTEKVLCQCSCKDKTVKILTARSIFNGISRSCGCLRNEVTIERMTKHGLQKSKGRKHPLAGLWGGIKSRCYNPNQPHYKHYGGRGIFMCKRWRDSLEAFIEDMGERPSKSSVDRIDTNGSYTCGKCEECIQNNYPANCKWSTIHEQHRNMNSNRMIEYNGRTQCLVDWAKETGITSSTLFYRLKNMTLEEALTTPKRW